VVDKIQEILIQKAREKKLAHFYLLSASSTDHEGYLRKWCEAWLQTLTNKNIHNHPDILTIDIPQEQRSYKWDDISEIFNFLNHNALEWDQKFIIIDSAHKLNDLMANKMLKVLEEPPVPCTFLMLNPLKKSLLHTIESRAVKLQIVTAGEALEVELPNLNEMDLHQFIEYFRNNPESEKHLTQRIYSQANFQSAQATLRMQEYQQLQKEDQTYYNSPQYRLFKLYRTLQQYPDLVPPSMEQ
jgi:hypothetical protein